MSDALARDLKIVTCPVDEPTPKFFYHDRLVEDRRMHLFQDCSVLDERAYELPKVWATADDIGNDMVQTVANQLRQKQLQKN